MDDLEKANDSQLHSILNELKQLSFFRNFVVDLEQKCPLTTTTTTVAAKDEVGEEEDTTTTTTDEDEFECSGGKDELDDDAEPLCTVDLGDDDNNDNDHDFFMNPFGGNSDFATTSNYDDLESNALNSIQRDGYESQQQEETFAWDKQTSLVVGETEPCDTSSDPLSSSASSSMSTSTVNSHRDDPLPPTFWMDICSNIKEGDGTKVVDLSKNPERNTGYDGQHIWMAMYEENCIISQEMCLEERILYRLLSGLHTSTTLSIAKNYYPPSKKKNRTSWESNPQFFMDKFQDHPEYIRNLHFAYVVTLRAIRKASKYLYDYPMASGNSMDDDAAKILLRRLLDSAILRSCSSVFSAFDESVMFQDSSGDAVSLQQNFKGVFHNISSILDCVQCQQCKLHGKMAMLGYGTALKILFVPEDMLKLERNEVVALINTIARLSESLIEVRELTELYWEERREKVEALKAVTPPASSMPQSGSLESFDLLDITVGLVSSLGRDGHISMDRESELIELALQRHPELLVLAKHYNQNVDRFLHFARKIGSLGDTNVAKEPPLPDAVIVGSGLAGLSAALNMLDRGGSVVIVEKEHLLGGNSNKASSGINGCCPQNSTYGDDLDSFREDTIKSAGEVADLNLIDTLVTKSENAIMWLKDRVGVDLSLLAQLGGHAHKRTHRPSNGMAGAEIIYHMQKAVRSYEKTGRVKIMVDTRVTKLIMEDDRVVGVSCDTANGPKDVLADNVVLATGGFAADRSNGSYLDQYRPELMTMPATAGEFSTGDGITLATSLGAATRDMDKIQIHPTGWVNPADPDNPSKILAAELMRGVGGVLINDEGMRFCNELGTRAYVTDKMLSHNANYTATGKWDSSAEVPTFHLILSSSAADDGKKHVDLYSHKGLLTKVEGIDALVKHTGLPKRQLVSTFKKYQSAALSGVDEFGKTSFRGVPMNDLSKETFHVGRVTPVLHYCMGGIKIDHEGNVMRDDGTFITGLHAAGEVTGGVHGNNRLGGNSLLECTVYGTIVGQKLPVKTVSPMDSMSTHPGKQETTTKKELPTLTAEDLASHNTPDDLWVAIHGIVYDFTDFADEHPAGAQSIIDLAGTDGTAAFAAVHNKGMLDDFEDDKKGIFVMST